DKLNWLEKVGNVDGVKWLNVTPDSNHNWLLLEGASEFGKWIPMGSKSSQRIFARFSTGAKSNRDDIVYGFDPEGLAKRVQDFVDAYNLEVDRYKRKGTSQQVDSFVDVRKIKWSSTLKLHLQRGRYAEYAAEKQRLCLYRPYTRQYLFYDEVLNDRPGLFRFVLPTAQSERQNVVICCTNHSQMPFVVLATNCIANEAVGGRAGTCFPFYVYDEDGSNRRENITDWALQQFRTYYADKKISKWDIFYYVYGLLHHPGYRTKFADNLKRELPRIPFAPDFRAFATAGKQLAALHLD